jgi:hypothetical protein
MDQPTSRNSNAGPESTEQLHPLGGPAGCSATGNPRYWSRSQHLEPSFDCHWSLVASMRRKRWSMKAPCSARCRALLYTSCSGSHPWWAVRVILHGLPAQHRLRIAETQVLSIRRRTRTAPSFSQDFDPMGVFHVKRCRGAQNQSRAWSRLHEKLVLPAMAYSVQRCQHLRRRLRSNSSMPGLAA